MSNIMWIVYTNIWKNVPKIYFYILHDHKKLTQFSYQWELTFVLRFGQCMCVFTHVSVCWCVCESQGASLPCLAQILAALRTLPCIRKHAGVGLESRSGLENDVATLLRPDFLLSLALCYLSPEVGVRILQTCLSRPTCNEWLEDSPT